MPDEAAAIHGLNNAILDEQGEDMGEVYRAWENMLQRADLIVGHNISFDLRMMRIMSARVLGEKVEVNTPTFCTMRASTNLCRIIGPRSRHPEDWKFPTLTEAMRHFFDEQHDGAHRARPDCDAARRIYFAIKQQDN